MIRPTRLGGTSFATQRVAARSGFTLVEMLIAMAITLVMMAAVATLFANVSGSVRNRRATIEMSNQIRHVRNVLQQDLQGATCPGLTWQRPESNHGYIELIEGQYRDSFPSQLTDGIRQPLASPPNPELETATSTVPRNNGAVDSNGNGRIDANEWEAHFQSDNSFVASVGPPANTLHVGASGLGDYDDILMLTVRNENEPFVGRTPTNLGTVNSVNLFGNWMSKTLESTLAEVVWFAIENPDADTNDSTRKFFGEPGMRTIYRRTLLIAPWVNPYADVANSTTGLFTEPNENGGKRFKAEPGLVRVLREDIGKDNVHEAFAALIAFQDRYDLSVRVEWDPNLQRWKLLANTLGDLTKRENRFGHFGHQFVKSGTVNHSRRFPYPMVSMGRGYASNTPDVAFIADTEIPRPPAASDDAKATANTSTAPVLGRIVVSYTIDGTQNIGNPSTRYSARPLAYVSEDSGMSSTARAMLNDDGEVVRVIHGPVPLWGTRRGEDVMLTNALAFDLRVYDPGAPLFGVREDLSNASSAVGAVVEPSDAGWSFAYIHTDNMGAATPAIGTDSKAFPYIGQGAYVDLGYGFNPFPAAPGLMPTPKYVTGFASASPPWFFTNNGLGDVLNNLLAPGYSVYDTWSFHYENNGRNDDGDEVNGSTGAWQLLDNDPPGREDDLPQVDEGTNGLDDYGHYSDGPFIRLGPDDAGERETVPPYDKPLRGVQVLVRGYELDSRAIRQVRVSQHFMPE